MISLPPGPLARNDSRRDSSSEIVIKEGYNRMGDNMQRATGSFGRVASYNLQAIRFSTVGYPTRSIVLLQPSSRTQRRSGFRHGRVGSLSGYRPLVPSRDQRIDALVVPSTSHS
jgi:hypothetical protein